MLAVCGVGVCVYICVRACVRACVRVSVCVCVSVCVTEIVSLVFQILSICHNHLGGIRDSPRVVVSLVCCPGVAWQQKPTGSTASLSLRQGGCWWQCGLLMRPEIQGIQSVMFSQPSHR